MVDGASGSLLFIHNCNLTINNCLGGKLKNTLSLDNYCVSINGTLLDALKVIDKDAEGLAVVLDDDNKVYGTLTDGDIRRALLGGDSLQLPLKKYTCVDFAFVSPEDDRAYVLDLMQAMCIRQAPILDDSKNLVGIHFLNRLIGHTERPNWAVIMAGGKGTRLHPITKNMPKPMVKVAGRPILERLILHLVSFGIQRIFLSINYMGHVIKDYFGDGERFGCAIEYLCEDEPLGTGGALSLLPETPTTPTLVLNGDLVMQVNLEHMLTFHNQNDYFATIGAHKFSQEIPYGCIETNGDHITNLIEKPINSFLVNAGIYVLSPEAIASIPKEYYPLTYLFEESIENNKLCGCFQIESEWADVGQVSDLRKAQGLS